MYRQRRFSLIFPTLGLLLGLISLTSHAAPPLRLAQGSEGGGYNRAKFVSQVVPENMKTDTNYNVTIQYKNEGRNGWSPDNYSLVLTRPKNRQTWGVTSADFAARKTVGPGGIATFRFNVRAPAQPGTYEFQWQMRDSSGWESEPTPLIKVAVEPAGGAKVTEAEFVFQNVPGMKKLGEYYAILEAGKDYPVTLMFKNTGTIPWRGPRYALVAQNPRNNMNWAIDRIDLGTNDVVKPGDMKAFSFNILTPTQPGIYNFQWQLYHDDGGWFGEQSENIAITVQ